MFKRAIIVGVLLLALISGAGVVSADSPTTGNACPEDGNPSNGLVQSVSASDGQSLNAAQGVNQAYESVGCDSVIG